MLKNELGIRGRFNYILCIGSRKGNVRAICASKQNETLWLDGRNGVIARRKALVPDDKAEGNRGLHQWPAFLGVARNRVQQ
jgi:hypothetical protein